MKKSIVVDYDNICAVCGSPKECTHHLIFGSGVHKLCDDDKLTIPMCNRCHNFALFRPEQIHENSMAESLSKMVGQLAWEENYLAEKYADLTKRLNEFTGDSKIEPADCLRQEARLHFMARYGRSYI